ncbi:MAG: Prophage antirepressor [candidate division CPR2 bacterium GW2011_GWC1_39_9]|nr:MAG: Prophage antirepressor [candidate division CPR2 bacterium GW2011_GWC1_39_9]
MDEISKNKIAIFQKKEIRRVEHNGEWWFSVVDVIEALTDSKNPRDYWYKMKIRVKDEDGFELSTICRQLKLESSDGKKYQTDCANTEGIFRIKQTAPTQKEYSVSSNRFRLQKPNPLSAGWPRLVTNGFKK